MGLTRVEKEEDFEFIMKYFFKFVDDKTLCKTIISDECYPLINVLKTHYPEIFSFTCALHKMKNIMDKIKKKEAGENY